MIMKSYTDLEQSKRLAEILPLESADMCFNLYNNSKMPPLMTPYSRFNEFYDMGETPNFLIPCWSLAALLEVLPKDKYKDIDLCHGGYKSNGYISEWFCSYEQQEPFILKIFNAPNAIDACYELVLKLHELNLL